METRNEPSFCAYLHMTEVLVYLCSPQSAGVYIAQWAKQLIVLRVTRVLAPGNRTEK